MSNTKTLPYLRAAAALGLVLTTIAASAQAPTPAPTTAEPAKPATVTVDFGKPQGPFMHSERYNNFANSRAFPQQRGADVRFYNQQGLHGSIYRVWLNAQFLYDPATGRFDYSGIEDYLAQASEVSDNLLVVMDTRVQIRDLKMTPEQLRPIIKTILRDLKQRYPKIRYVEAFNEPDYNLAKVTTAAGLYDFYVPAYQAVNEINRELKPRIPLEVGGPAFMQFNEEWMRAFLDRYKADRAPDKRLDFISYHGYGRFPPGTGEAGGPRAFHFYKNNPSEVADERAKLDAELRRRGLDTRIPAFVTETGIYPGPSFDHPQDPHADYLISAAGMLSLQYWWIGQPKTIPFNWVVRHTTEERKDQLITRVGEGKTPPTGIFSPYGNALLMLSKLKNQRVAARSDALTAGIGLYAIATRDRSGAAVLVWNYQHVGTQSYRTTIDMGQLPAELRGKPLRQRLFRIDDKVSNYWGDPATANLQQVGEAVVKPNGRHRVTIDLTPNALELVVLEPAK